MNIKRISMLVLLLMLAASLVFSFASCTQEEPDNGDTDGGDGKVSYTVTVKDQYGAAVKGAKVQLYLDGMVPLGSKVDTGDDGKATISIKPQEGAISANVESLPYGYVPYAGAKVAIKDGAATVTVEALPTYTVYVKDAAGNAVAGVAVQLCDDAGCKLPQVSDAEGKIVFRIAASNYKAQLNNVPAGYVKSDDYHFFNSNNEVTITLVSAE